MARFSDAAMSAGRTAEEDARWYIDRSFHGGKNWKVLHDLVFGDLKGNCWCQIDHLIFNRFGEFIVIETKSATSGMTLHEKSGAFSLLHNGFPKPIKSPIVQNLRHIEVLRDFLIAQKIMPRRLLVPIAPVFRNWILIQPGVALPREYGGARLIQRDQFDQELIAYMNEISVFDLVRVMSRKEISEIAGKLEAESRENKRLREGATKLAEEAVSSSLSSHPPSCDEDFAPKAAPKYISGTYRKILSKRTSTPSTDSFSSQLCQTCRTPMTFKEVSFCRFNFKRLGRRYLCRTCQGRI